jgi:hypothetical protein
VDIISDDNKADTSGRKVADELKSSSSPRDLPTMDGDDEQIDIGTNLDYTSTSSHIDLNNFNIDSDEAAYTAAATKNIGASKVKHAIINSRKQKTWGVLRLMGSIRQTKHLTRIIFLMTLSSE